MTIPKGRSYSDYVSLEGFQISPWDESTRMVVRITNTAGLRMDCEFVPSHGLNAPLYCAESDVLEMMKSAPSITLSNGRLKADILVNADDTFILEVLTVDTDGKQVYP